MSRRAFKPDGTITKEADAILRKERKHFGRMFAAARGIDVRDLQLLLIYELNLAGALESVERQRTALRR